ncbi:MAG: DUF6702 family protein [Flavicella sp.]
MKSKLNRILILICIIFTVCSFNHPIKLTASLIEYDNENKVIKIECKLFIDDFERSINTELPKNIDISNLTEEDKTAIENYFDKRFIISLNETKIPLKFASHELHLDYNVVTIRFSKSALSIKEGDSMKVKNILFFEEFSYMQSNRVTIMAQPFFQEYNMETNIDTKTFTYNF